MGRYDPPDPKCSHVNQSVRVASHRDLLAASRRSSAVASVWVCARPACVRDAEQWVTASTGRTPVRFESEKVR
jgi:hypothetical protein